MRLGRAWQGAFSHQPSAFSGNGKGFLYLASPCMAGFKITLYAGSASSVDRPALQNKEQAQPDFHSSGENSHWCFLLPNGGEPWISYNSFQDLHTAPHFPFKTTQYAGPSPLSQLR